MGLNSSGLVFTILIETVLSSTQLKYCEKSLDDFKNLGQCGGCGFAGMGF